MRGFVISPNGQGRPEGRRQLGWPSGYLTSRSKVAEIPNSKRRRTAHQVKTRAPQGRHWAGPPSPKSAKPDAGKITRGDPLLAAKYPPVDFGWWRPRIEVAAERVEKEKPGFGLPIDGTRQEPIGPTFASVEGQSRIGERNQNCAIPATGFSWAMCLMGGASSWGRRGESGERPKPPKKNQPRPGLQDLPWQRKDLSGEGEHPLPF